MALAFKKVTVAALQVCPVLPFDAAATVEKACRLIERAAGEGAGLVVFPECFLPMYPSWSVDLQRPGEWARNLKALYQESVTVPGPEVEALAEVARASGAYVVMGVNERVEHYDGRLYNTLVFIGPEEGYIGKHRKLVPSNREKVFHTPGDASGLKVHPTCVGRLGGLICYEHLQPLLKYALISQGEQIHCAAWPGWPHFKEGRSNREVIEVGTRQYALEGQCFVVAASLYVPPDAVPEGYLGKCSWDYFGGSCIAHPNGDLLAGPLFDEEGILYAELDLGDIVTRKAAVDVTGKDALWDVFHLKIDQGTPAPFTTKGDSP